MVESLRRLGVRHAPVLDAMAQVPRHAFIDAALASRAYEDVALPIGHGQTISKPSTVARMLELVAHCLPEARRAGSQVLEVGTGCGYQAAVLAEIVRLVHTIEIVEPLGRAAASALSAAGYRNVRTRIGDGYAGWPEEAPFDAIMVTAAAPYVPQPLIDQLKNGGRLVIPLGGPDSVQALFVIEKDAQGTVTRRKVLDVRFVPLTRKQG